MRNGERVLPLSRLCVKRTDCKGLLLGFSSGPDDALAKSAASLAASLRGSA